MSDFAFRSSPDARRDKSEKTVHDPKLGKVVKRDVFGKTMDEQHRVIANRFGKDTADRANYGWGDNGEGSVATKVYRSKGARVLTSEGVKGEPVYHRWDKY